MASLALSALLAAGLDAPAAQAGTYKDIQTGGTTPATITPPADANPAPPAPLGPLDAIAYSAVTPYSPNGNPTYTIQISPGTLTDTFTWTHDNAQQDNTTDPPPSCVIVEQTSGATWYVRNDWGTGSGSGKVDCGLPGATVTSGTYNAPLPSLALSGVLYSVKTSPRASFPVSCSPTASFTGTTGTEGSVEGEAEVSGGASVYPITISLSGTLTDSNGNPALDGNGNQQALVGQQIKAALNGIPTFIKITSYTWSFMGGTKGNPIKGWDGKNNTIQLTPWLPADFSQTDTTGSGLSGVAPISFYDEINKDTITVKCVVNLTFPDGTTGTITAQSAPVIFMKPTVAWTVNTAFNNIAPGFYRDYPNQQFGAREPWGPITITEPAALVKSGPGTGCVVQVANLDRSYARTTTSKYSSVFSKIQIVNGDGTNGMAASPTGLDVQFPYPFGFVKNADGTFTASQNTYTWKANTKGYAVDEPFTHFTLNVSDGGGNMWYSATANDNFNTWVMYLPPANGLGTIYVPLQTLKWGWGGNASLSGGVWSVSEGPSFDPGMPADAPTPPAWSLYIPYLPSIGP